MIRIFKIELEKLFGNYRFYISAAGIALGLMLTAFNDLMHGGGKSGAESLVLLSKTQGIVILSFMLCVIGGAFSYCEEEKNGNLRMVTGRSGRVPYTRAKLMSAFIGGYCSVLLGNFLAYTGMMLMIKVWYKGAERVCEGGSVMGEMLIYFFGVSLLGALLSEVGLMITTIIPNFFVGMATPVLFYYFWLSLADWFHFSVYLRPVCYWGYSPEYWSSWQAQMLYALLMTACFSYVIYLICARMIRRRLEND